MHLRARHLPLSAALVAVAAAVAATACAPPTPTRYVDRIFPVATRSGPVRYATAPDLVSQQPVELQLEVLQPAGDRVTKRPAIVWVHSGGFRGGSRQGTNGVAGEYAQRGYVSFSIDYRLDPGNRCLDVQAGTIKDPAQLAKERARCEAAILAAQHDAQAAVRWVRANAAKYGVDPAKIAMAGFSAGAVTALHAAYRSDDPGDVGDQPGTDSHIQAALSASGCNYYPESIGAGDAPVQLTHARFDVLVPFSCAQDTAKRATAAGLVAKTLFYQVDFGHAELLYAEHKAEIDAAWTSFLVAQLHLP
jgi:acetyl esterase/lipase